MSYCLDDAQKEARATMAKLSDNDVPVAEAIAQAMAAGLFAQAKAANHKLLLEAIHQVLELTQIRLAELEKRK